MSDNVGFIGKIKEKLIKSREKAARDGRHMTAEVNASGDARLPPGQNLVQKWPVLDLGIQPDIRKRDWSLRIDGDVENPMTLDWKAYKTQVQKSQINDIHCVTSWSRYDNHFEGVSSQTILDMVKPKANVAHVIFHSFDGYTTNVTLDVFSDDDVLLAHSWEGHPLSRQHGGPVRVMIPKWYSWKSAKWIKRIEFSAVDKPGFWEIRGYHNEGDPWLEDRYSK